MDVKPSTPLSQSSDEDNSEKSVLMKHTNTVIKSSHGIAERKSINQGVWFRDAIISKIIEPSAAIENELMKTSFVTKMNGPSNSTMSEVKKSINTNKSQMMKFGNASKSEKFKPCNASKSKIVKFGNVSKSVVIKPCDAFKAEMMTKTCVASKPKALKQRNASVPEVMKPRGFKKLGMKSKEKGRSQRKVNISVLILLQLRYNLDATLM